MTFLMSILGWLSRGPLDRILSTVDKRVEAETDKTRIKAKVVETYIQNRAGWMKSGGIWTLIMFAAPAALWRGSVYIYSLLWCNVCMFPQDWAIGDIPPQFKNLDGWIVLASIGALGLVSISRR